MKKYFWIGLMTIFCLGCRKEYECYAQKKEGGNIDSTLIPCKCFKPAIEDLENSIYTANDTVYNIKCFEQ